MIDSPVSKDRRTQTFACRDLQDGYTETGVRNMEHEIQRLRTPIARHSRFNRQISVKSICNIINTPFFFKQGETIRPNESFIKSSGSLGTCHAIQVEVFDNLQPHHHYYSVIQHSIMISNWVMTMRECYVPPSIHLIVSRHENNRGRLSHSLSKRNKRSRYKVCYMSTFHV